MDGSDRFLVIPKSGSGRGVLVLHSWWGLTNFFREFCGRLASRGFVALAPDLYGGKVAATAGAARRLRASASRARREPAYKFLIRQIEYLRTHEAVTGPQIGLLGFSMGGHWAFWLAQRPELQIAATVTFYAARSGDFARSRSAFLCHFAEHDDWVSPAAIKKLARHLDLAGVSATFHTYPGTTHWFFESDRADSFEPKAAALAWKRTVAFLTDIGRLGMLPLRGGVG
jgi:carboxymethylenebutenolidase